MLLVLLPSHVSAQTDAEQKGQVFRFSARGGLPLDPGGGSPVEQSAMVFRGKELSTRPRPQQRSNVMPDVPPCERSVVRRMPVAHATPILDALDIVFYSAVDRRQRGRAERWEGDSIAYQAGSRIDYTKMTTAPLQLLAQTFRVECLPTRLHFVTDNDVRYIEFREGDKAWE
ncbi:MAG: hypothetical protein KDD44_13110 [Bdellovibrionales bacterium]|nr:hypothetical protein [Bdellovibrionales bacterium]